MIRVGLIGAGKMGLSHYAILNAHPGVEVAAVADTSGLVLSMLQKCLGIKTGKDYRQMLALDRLDGVVIATPPKTHAEAVTWALQHGLHVFVEKPLWLSAEDARRLALLADRQEQAHRANRSGAEERDHSGPRGMPAVRCGGPRVSQACRWLDGAQHQSPPTDRSLLSAG